VQFFDPNNPMSIVWVGAVMALSVVLSFVLTLVLGFEDIPVAESSPKTPAAAVDAAKPVNAN
jgi:beta-glucoside (arbutin/salicin/cellobiose) PTS system EIICB component